VSAAEHCVSSDHIRETQSPGLCVHAADPAESVHLKAAGLMINEYRNHLSSLFREINLGWQSKQN